MLGWLPHTSPVHGPPRSTNDVPPAGPPPNSTLNCSTRKVCGSSASRSTAFPIFNLPFEPAASRSAAHGALTSRVFTPAARGCQVRLGRLLLPVHARSCSPAPPGITTSARLPTDRQPAKYSQRASLRHESARP